MVKNILYKIDLWLYINLPMGNYGQLGAKPNIFTRFLIKYRKFLTGYIDPRKWYIISETKVQTLKEENLQLLKEINNLKKEVNNLKNNG
jgi:hypothetical protein